MVGHSEFSTGAEAVGEPVSGDLGKTFFSKT